MNKISINPDNQIFKGNKYIGYIDDNDVYLFVKGYAEKIGSVDHKAKVESLIQSHNNLLQPIG